MRIAVIASGSRGDVQPYVALGVGLARAGHDVRLLSHQNFAALAGEHGLEFWAAESDVRGIAAEQQMAERVEQGNFLLLMAEMAKAAEREAQSFVRAGLEACQGMDLLVAGMGGGYMAMALADKLNIPYLQAYLLPFTPTSAFPAVVAPGLPTWTGGAVNRLSHRSADTLSRRAVLGLPPAPFAGPYRSAERWGMPTLYGYSPAIVPKPADWGLDVHVTGYWFLDAAQSWTPPPALVDFLAAGPAPVYVGFGSMSSRKPEQTTELVLEALRRAGQRAVLLAGWGGLKKTDLPDSVLMIDSAPHAWLFPRMAAVVHHGGAGTTAAGLRAGVPAVIIPFFGDQPFWGQRVAQAGAGPRAIPRQQLTVERLADAIRQATGDEAMRGCAARLGEQIRAEDGLARAAEIIGQIGQKRI